MEKGVNLRVVKPWSRLPRQSFMFPLWKILKKGWMKIGLAVPACVSVTLGLDAPLSSFLVGVV